MQLNQPIRKFEDKIDVSEWEIKTDYGYKPIRSIGKTVPYDVWEVVTEQGKTLRCADTHILYDLEYDEIFVKDLNRDSRPDCIQTEDGVELVTNVIRHGYQENMYDIEVDDRRHRYYTNGILSHNSIFLCNDAVNFVLAGKNVVFITCEMSDKKVIKRIDANLLDINIDDYDSISIDVEYMAKKIIAFRERQIVPPGKLYIKEYPTSCCTVADVENYIKCLQETKGFKVDVVVIDYINIMAAKGNFRTDDNYNKIKQISEDLRALAIRNSCLVVTATQTNRSAFDSNDIEVSNIAESVGLLYTVDTLYGIIQDADMRVNKEYLIKLLKVRDGQGKNSKMQLTVNYKKMRLSETGVIYRDNETEPTNTADAGYRPKDVQESTPINIPSPFSL